jgi:hypothetical protein
LPHTIRVTFGLADQKPIVSSALPWNGDDAARRGVFVRIGIEAGTDDPNLAKKYNYIGTVTLVK